VSARICNRDPFEVGGQGLGFYGGAKTGSDCAGTKKEKMKSKNKLP